MTPEELATAHLEITYLWKEIETRTGDQINPGTQCRRRHWRNLYRFGYGTDYQKTNS
jgi:hypothetical protein